ncbi:MAG: chorismate synthase [Flavobacteriales bacterium]|nr:chorismate synthase [Flavobacteriales bacterium]
MPGNSIGSVFRLTAFGESHGPAIGGVIDGCPAGLPIDALRVQQELDRRRPGSTPLGTSRQEADHVEWLSGMLDGRTLGTPIAFLIRNNDALSADYDALKEVYRPGHADRVYDVKYGLRDHRGGGRSSARVTAAAVVGGAIARQMLLNLGVEVAAFVSQVGEVRVTRWPQDLERRWIDPVRCPDESSSAAMAAAIEEARNEGDSLGGAVSCVIRGLPVGLGEPIYDKLDADLAKAMLSINASKAFAIGEGFGAAGMRGSQHNKLSQGGVTGGISDGDELRFEVAFKPPSTIAMPQQATTRSGDVVMLEARGRHDPCVVPRAVPIVEAMSCLVLADHWLRLRCTRL